MCISDANANVCPIQISHISHRYNSHLSKLQFSIGCALCKGKQAGRAHTHTTRGYGPGGNRVAASSKVVIVATADDVAGNLL